MNKLYDRIDFENNNTPALNETNLNLMSKAIDDIDDRVIEIAGDVLVVVPEILDKYVDIEALATNPPYVGQNGHWWTWDTDTNQYVDSGVDAGVSVTVGTTSTLPAGSDATVTNSGTDTDPILNFGIPQGAAGQDGAPGIGVPTGGTTDQVLAKNSNTDYDFKWVNQGGGSGGHTIINSAGTSMTQRTGLQFEGMGVTDDSTNDRTKVKLPIFNGTTAQWEALSSTEKAKYTIVNFKNDYGSQKIYEVTFEKGVDSFTHDTTNNRYTCQKTFGDSSVLRNIDEFEIRLEIHTTSNTAIQVASENIKLSDQLLSTVNSYYLGVTWISPIGGNINRFIYCQFGISKTGSGTVVADLFIGDTQYNVCDIIKFSLYRE